MAGQDNLYLGSGTVYVAPVGTAFPEINAEPGVNWFRVGVQGDLNYSEDGITMRRSVSVTEIRTLGTTMTRKVAITEAGFEIEFSVLDMDPAMLLLAMGGDEDDVTDVAAGETTAGTSAIAIPTSPVPVQKAVLLRIPMSTGGPQFNTDVRIQVAMQAGGGEATISKSSAMAFQHVWKVLEPAEGDAVVVIQQTALPTGP